MRTSILIALGLLASLAMAFALLRERSSDATGDLAARLEALDDRVASLVYRLEDIEARATAPPAGLVVPVGREAVAAQTSPSPATAAEHDARWYLEQYVRSFESDEGGAEYYRLVVDAHAAELVDAIVALAVEPNRPVLLRLALVRMLARISLRADTRVLHALVLILRQNAPQPLAQACLQAWTRTAGPDAVRLLEAVMWEITDREVLQRAIQALTATAGAGANASLLRLFGSAPDEAAAALLLQALDGGDVESALQMFERASHASQPVRLAAAHRIGVFDGERFTGFVDTWLGFETDAAVIAALGGAKQRQRSVAGWSAMQAVGPPDADPRRDDPKAWAPRDPQMGTQWLELRYPRADHVQGVRIFEVNAPGAVGEVRARDGSGTWHTLWKGRASVASGPLALTFSATPFVTNVLRVVLDTNRVPGWNEIDAVELLGAGGAQFAERATASSSYAERAQGGPQPAGMPERFR